MSAPDDNGCNRTDAVLALYLDGDIGVGNADDSGFELVCPDTLANHLADCELCQLALQRARRLDAVLAEQAGRSMSLTAAGEPRTEADVDRLFAAVAERAAENPYDADLTSAMPIDRRAEADPAFVQALAEHGAARRHLFTPERETAEWQAVLETLA